ncbi:MAG: hypothetical protein WCH74_14930 [Chloroflexota bacterium]
MPRMVITHAVVDIEQWLKGKAERASLISTVATDVTDHVALDGSKSVAITGDAHDIADVQAMLALPSPELADAMQRHGVLPPVTVYIEK